ncbi:MAG: tRNA pseudouridine(54/55) synthase Pus10, partial [Candidatus Micrarchaeota archaeon]
LASLLKKSLGKAFSFDSPDIIILLDFEENEVKVSISPLFIYGHYKKFSREISQTKWPCDCRNGCEECKGTMFKYSSVEDLISAPLLNAFKAKSEKFHGAGREDIDARMLGDGRPFVFELEGPLKRNVDLKSLQDSINSEFHEKIELSRLSFAPPKMVETVKMARLEKSYKALVQTTSPISRQKLSKIPRVVKLKQQTPNRVLHRRSDLERLRSVRVTNCKQLGPTSFELTMNTDSGTYVKEFISGDGGRTKPSISELLGVPAVCAELDVIGISHFFVSEYW